MEQNLAHPSQVYRAKLDTSGRIVLPLAVREQLRLTTGDEVLVIQSGDSCYIETPEQALRAAQEYFRKLAPPGVSMVDELLAERRAEAVREAEELARDESLRE
jgi:AbrB family looped-hinge helix DNA binding protein